MSPDEERAPTWSPLQRRLHWLVAGLVLGQYLLQDAMRSAGETVARGETVSAGEFLVTTLHTWGGAAVAALVVCRLVLRRRAPVPVAAGGLGAGAARLVRWHHLALYAALVAMVLSGALHYYAGVEAAARWHGIGKWVLAALVAVHVGGALRHALRPGDTVLQRMWSGGERRSHSGAPSASRKPPAP